MSVEVVSVVMAVSVAVGRLAYQSTTLKIHDVSLVVGGALLPIPPSADNKLSHP